MSKTLYHATLKQNLPSIKKSGLILSKVNTGLGLSQNGIYFATDIQTLSRIMDRNHDDYVVLKVKDNKVSKYPLIPDPLAFGLEGKAFYTENDVPWEDLEYVGILSELENSVLDNIEPHFSRHFQKHAKKGDTVEGTVDSVKVSIQNLPNDGKVRIVVEGLPREHAKAIGSLGFVNPSPGVFNKFVPYNDIEQIKKVITDVSGVVMNATVKTEPQTTGPATKETKQGIEDKSKIDGDKNKTDKVQKHMGNQSKEQPQLTNTNKQEGPAKKEKTAKLLDKSKIVKEKHGEGYSIEINGVEYRYSSTKHTAEEIKATVDKLMKSSEGKALQWLKANTVNYYGGKDKRTLTADQKASREAAKKAEEQPQSNVGDIPVDKDHQPQDNQDFENQLKRIEKFADTQVKELDKDPAWTFKYIDDRQEMAQYKMTTPGLILLTGYINKDAKELNEHPVVKKFNKSKTLKRFRNWFNTTYQGMPTKAIIYIDANAARTKGVKGLKEAYENVEFFNDEIVIINEQAYIFDVIDNRVILINEQEELSIEL